VIGAPAASRGAWRAALLGLAAWSAAGGSAAAQETVHVNAPLAVNFSVTDVTRSTTGNPDPGTLAFSGADLIPGRSLRISIQADAATFTPPSGPGMAAGKVSWVIAGAAGGTGSNGTLSSSSYALVFESDPGRTSGHVDLTWVLAPPDPGIRAGAHQLTIRWKLEAITP
jgi:hypothetical protein